MVNKSPNWGCSPSKWPKWRINGGYQLLTNWDDPPSGANYPHPIANFCWGDLVGKMVLQAASATSKAPGNKGPKAKP